MNQSINSLYRQMNTGIKSAHNYEGSYIRKDIWLASWDKNLYSGPSIIRTQVVWGAFSEL